MIVRFVTHPQTKKKYCPECGNYLPVKISHFDLVDIIGAGGMGAVYRGFDTSLERPIAIKVMREELARNPQFVENFLREARAAAALNHPNVAQIYSFGEENGRYYLVMELLSNGSLDDRIEKSKRLQEVEVLDIGIQVASGLRAAHERNLIHRDIKPGNILFTQSNVAKVVDFGLARFEASSHAQKEEGIWGTPYYIAPEKVADGQEDFRSDIYSLGGTLFHALAGRPPFEAGTSTEVVLKHLRAPSVSLLAFAPECTPQTADVIGRMLKRDPNERPQSYDEVLNDLAYAKRFALEKKPMEAVEQKTEFSMGLLIGVLLLILVCISALILVWINRAKIFASPKKPGIAMTHTNAPRPGADIAPQPPPQPQPPPPPVVLDFSKQIEAAYETTVKGNFQGLHDKLLAIDKQIPSGDPAFGWAKIHLARLELLMDKDGNAHRILNTFLGNISPDALSTPVGAPQYPQTLGLILNGKLKGDAMNRVMGELPGWMRAIATFDAGLVAFKKDQYDASIGFWKSYAHSSGAGDQSWVLFFQVFTINTVSELEEFKNFENQLNELRSRGQHKEVLQLLQEKQNNWRMTRILSRVAKWADESRQASAAAQKILEEKNKNEHAARLRDDIQLVADKKAGVAALLGAYQFEKLRDEWRAAESSLKTNEQRKIVATQVAVSQCLADFWKGIVQDVAAYPYDQGRIVSRMNKRSSGRLVQLNDERVIFRVEIEGQVAETSWSTLELPPSALIELGDFYLGRAAAANNSADAARRAVMLMVFAREYSLPDAVIQRYLAFLKQTPPNVKELGIKVKLDVRQPVLLK
ncbi:MAG: serine/threonine-protein kinase [Verrucomicrobiae bacterium]|nr:serine/threonine-protein kinase [Verrucomicrobiae bacterium]